MSKNKQRSGVDHVIFRKEGFQIGAPVYRYVLLLALVLLGVLIYLAWGQTSKAIVAATLIASCLSTLAIWISYRSERRTTGKLEHLAWQDAQRLYQSQSHQIPSHEAESEVLIRALEVFGDSKRAIEWMRESNPALHEESPFRAIQTTSSREEVLRILGRIEHGVIS
ncbi:MAG: MbcA/ParS/Xre antitoxin family protein [Bryobacteraceae bacterium]